jgi:hypothetical protein
LYEARDLQTHIFKEQVWDFLIGIRLVFKIGSSLTHLAKFVDSGRTGLAPILSSSFITLISFFYTYTIASYLQTTINDLENRVIYFETFQSYVVNQFVDQAIIVFATVLWLGLSIKGKKRYLTLSIYGGATVAAMVLWSYSDILLDAVALLSLPTIVSLLAYDRLAGRRNIINLNGVLIQNFFALLGIALGIVAVIILAIPIIFSEPLPVRNHMYEIFTLLSSSFSPILMIVLLFCFPAKLLIDELRPRRFIKNRYIEKNSKLFTYSLRPKTKIVSLILCILMCIVLVLIPHQPAINKDGQLVGVDTHYYVDWVNILNQSSGAPQIIQQAFFVNNGDRPLTLLFLYLIVHFTDASSSLTIEFVPLVLGPALVLAIYFLSREITSGNELASIIAAFLTSVSIQTLVGIYAGFYANWLAITIGYFSLVFLFRFLKTPSKLNLAIFSFLLIGILLTHVYSWNIFVLVMGIFLLIAYKLKLYSNKNIIILALVLLSCFLIDVSRAAITNTPLAIQHILQTANIEGKGSVFGLLDNFALRWDNIIDTQTKYAGLFGNFAILALGVVWLLVSNFRQQSTIFLVVFLSIGILPLFLGNWLIQSRVFYNIPFQIPAALALAYLINHYKGGPIFVAVCIWLVAMSIRAVSHFYYVSPS